MPAKSGRSVISIPSRRSEGFRCSPATCQGNELRGIHTVRTELVEVRDRLYLQKAGQFTLRQAQGERDSWFKSA